MTEATGQSAAGFETSVSAEADSSASQWDAWILRGTASSAAFLDEVSVHNFFATCLPPVGGVVSIPHQWLPNHEFHDEKRAPYLFVLTQIADTNIRIAHGDQRHVALHTHGSVLGAEHSTPRQTSIQQIVHEIRYKTNLTWSQIANALDVQPRSLHYWAEGRPANSGNVERIMELAREINRLATDDPAETTNRLLAPRDAEPSVYMDFCQRSEDAKIRKPGSLGIRVDDDDPRRRPVFRPSQLIDARHDEVGSMEGEYVKTIRRTDPSG